MSKFNVDDEIFVWGKFIFSSDYSNACSGLDEDSNDSLLLPRRVYVNSVIIKKGGVFFEVGMNMIFHEKHCFKNKFDVLTAFNAALDKL